MSTVAYTVMRDSLEFHAKLALGTQEWLKRAADGQMEVREPVCHALELKMSITRAPFFLLGSRAWSFRYLSWSVVVSCVKAAMTAALVRGSRTAKSGVSARMRVPAGIEEVEKQPRPSPGEGRTVYSWVMSVELQ
jgi:hypothetical protein